MPDVPGAVTLLGGLLVLASALGAIIAGTRTGTLRATVTDQQAAIAALKELVEVTRMEASQDRAGLEEQRAANKVLTETLTGANEIAHILALQVEAAKTANDNHSEIMKLLVPKVPDA